MATLAAGLVLALGSGDVSPADAGPFPPFAEVRRTWSFAHAHLCWLAAESAGAVPEPTRLAWWNATAPRYNAWWLLDEATMPGRRDEYRVRCLWELRLLLGPADYAAGRMPCPVALEFFKEW